MNLALLNFIFLYFTWAITFTAVNMDFSWMWDTKKGVAWSPSSRASRWQARRKERPSTALLLAEAGNSLTNG